MKKNIIVLDVETTGGLNNPIVYDLGFAVVNPRGRILYSKSFIIGDIFFDEKKMSSAYYAEKIPMYKEKIARNEIEVIANIEIAYYILNEVSNFYSVNQVYAYNANFDRRALNNSLDDFYESKKIPNFGFSPFVEKRQWKCIWHIACQTVCKTKEYKKFCIDNMFISEKGNIQTSAERVYAFLLGNKNYQEEHTGLEDVLIEKEILFYCLKNHRNFSKEINSQCWRIPQKKKKDNSKIEIRG